MSTDPQRPEPTQVSSAVLRSTPLRIGIITAGRTDQTFSKEELAFLNVKARHDRDFWPDVDPGLRFFLRFQAFIGKSRSNAPPAEVFIIGGVINEFAFSGAMAELGERPVDVIIWWTIAPLTSDGADRVFVKTALDFCALTGKMLIYPCSFGTGLEYDRLPSFFPCGAVEIHGSRLSIAKGPNFDGENRIPYQSAPKVMTWGTWSKFRSCWLSLDLPPDLIPKKAEFHPHIIAFWSICTAILNILRYVPEESNVFLAHKILSRYCVDIHLPRQSKPLQFGFFDPRIGFSAGLM